MSTTSDQFVRPQLAEVARKTGLILRPTDSNTVNDLFAKLEKYDADERAETFDYLKDALNETRASVGAEPIYSE
jgi:hypothetical protein